MWGTCAVIVLVINMGLPKKTVHSRRGVAYLATGAIAGAAIGLAISQTWLALGAVLGLVLGCVAYVGTPAGRDLSAKPKRILNLLCEKGLPTVITVTISVIAIFWSLIVITQS